MSGISRVLVASVLLFGCKSNRDEPSSSTPTTPRTAANDETPHHAPATVPGPGLGTTTGTARGTAQEPAPMPTDTKADLSDASILAIGGTAHQIEIDAGKAAVAKTQNADVKAFAQMMVDDHTAALAQGKALGEKLGITPAEDDTTKGMRAKADAKQQQMAKMTGTDFDKAYVADQVLAHQEVLDKLDNELIPSADNTELKDMLTSLRGKVAQHLEHAKMLQTKMK
jgi:putative membrane protein